MEPPQIQQEWHVSQKSPVNIVGKDILPSTEVLSIAPPLVIGCHGSKNGGISSEHKLRKGASRRNGSISSNDRSSRS